MVDFPIKKEFDPLENLEVSETDSKHVTVEDIDKSQSETKDDSKIDVSNINVEEAAQELDISEVDTSDVAFENVSGNLIESRENMKDSENKAPIKIDHLELGKSESNTSNFEFDDEIIEEKEDIKDSGINNSNKNIEKEGFITSQEDFSSNEVNQEGPAGIETVNNEAIEKKSVEIFGETSQFENLENIQNEKIEGEHQACNKSNADIAQKEFIDTKHELMHDQNVQKSSVNVEIESQTDRNESITETESIETVKEVTVTDESIQIESEIIDTNDNNVIDTDEEKEVSTLEKTSNADLLKGQVLQKETFEDENIFETSDTESFEHSKTENEMSEKTHKTIDVIAEVEQSLVTEDVPDGPQKSKTPINDKEIGGTSDFVTENLSVQDMDDTPEDEQILESDLVSSTVDKLAIEGTSNGF